jgi:hypothetical protein
MMRQSMDRQLRNIALITLLLAALTIIAVVSPEHHRSTTNTVILAVAIVAVAGGTAALALGSVWLAVLRRDLREWRDARPSRRWIVSYYLAQEESVEPRESGVSLVFYSPNVQAVRAAGPPCLIIDLKPRTQDKTEARRLKGALRVPEASGGIVELVQEATHVAPGQFGHSLWQHCLIGPGASEVAHVAQ